LASCVITLHNRYYATIFHYAGYLCNNVARRATPTLDELRCIVKGAGAHKQKGSN